VGKKEEEKEGSEKSKKKEKKLFIHTGVISKKGEVL